MPRAKIEKTAKTCNLLTPLEIKNAKLPEGKAETALNDGGGLYLDANSHGRYIAHDKFANDLGSNVMPFPIRT